jgi:hypothetical protein
LEWGVGIFAFLLALSTMLLFMMNTIADRVDTLIQEQNTAVLKLSDNLRYFQAHLPPDELTLSDNLRYFLRRYFQVHLPPPPAELSIPPGLLSDLVEFSRKTRITKDEVHRLRNLERFLTFGLWRETQDPSQLTHVKADIEAREIWGAGVNQIQEYQTQRDDSQEACTSYKDFGGAVYTYLFPLFYALLGAGLWHLRCYLSRETLRSALFPGAHYTIAMIAGAVIGVINLNSLSLPPLLLAFLFGYSADIFAFRLDGLLDKLRMPSGRA